jgi:hypothetical protein
MTSRIEFERPFDPPAWAEIRRRDRSEQAQVCSRIEETRIAAVREALGTGAR